MRIQAINNQTFGNRKSYGICKEYPESFYTLSEDGKLDVLYGMLVEQKRDLITLSKNQQKLQSFNYIAADTMLNNFDYVEYSYFNKLINKADKNSKIDIIS